MLFQVRKSTSKDKLYPHKPTPRTGKNTKRIHISVYQLNPQVKNPPNPKLLIKQHPKNTTTTQRNTKKPIKTHRTDKKKYAQTHKTNWKHTPRTTPNTETTLNK
jgi:hypothetical protein